MSIARFVLRRLGSGALAVVGASLLVFAFLHLVPGDPVDHLAGGEATPEQRAKLEACMGLDRSLPAQFGLFLEHVADGSLGHQCPNPEHRPTVAARLADALPHTVALAFAAMAVAIVLALPLGILAALRRGSWIDAALSIGSLLGVAAPMMLLAPILLLVFFVELGWLPGPTETGPAAIVLPAVALGVHLMALLARMTRASLVAALGEDYVRTARAKGAGERRVALVHALRNALLPIVTVAGLQFGSLLGGAVITEKVFARPGLGLTLLDAIAERDYPVVQGTVLVIAAMYVVVNLVVDLAYGVVDPRIRRA
ncbi:MAG TPA: ABC transporter permease [Acidimicrobiia bacterium]|nr:ABC transporter permease [Acidimicrobiia bacterium]